MASRFSLQRVQLLVVCLLALVASGRSLRNRFTQDDRAVIEANAEVHTLDATWKAFGRPYWPLPFSRDLYRPLSSAGFAVQWVASHGKPWLFRLVSIALYVAAAAGVYALGRRLLPPSGAFVAAALFAVHPVHVEASAVAVNQSEIGVAVLALLAMCRYLDIRRGGGARGGGAPSGGDVAFLCGVTLVACITKETGIVIPALLGAAEILLVTDPRPWSQRLRALAPLAIGCAVVGAGFVAVRSHVLNGDLIGSFTAEGLRGLTPAQRALTMLGVLPRIVMLLIWPAHLQGDYSPGEILGAKTWGEAQTLGAVLLVLIVAAAIYGFRRSPVLTFGIVWAALAYAPVANILVATGIVLAERTLFLPSVGIMLSLGTLVPAVEAALARARPAVRYAAHSAFGAVLVAGAYSSFERQAVWRDPMINAINLVVDAPSSYRAHHSLAEMYAMAGQPDKAEREYRTAIGLFDRSFVLYYDLADMFRLQGKCGPAIPLYEQSIEIAPKIAQSRASLLACLAFVGRYQEASDLATQSVAAGVDTLNFKLMKVVTDSALRTNAALGTIRFGAKPPTESERPPGMAAPQVRGK